MAIGLGQMLIGGLIGSQMGKGKGGGIMDLLGMGGGEGEENKAEMPTHTMPDGSTMPGATHPEGGYAQAPQAPQAPQGGGFMDMLGNPTQSQIANAGMAFNSMRLRPDDNLAESFQKTIDTAEARKLLGAKTTATAKYLDGLVSEKYPQGRTDLKAMLLQGILSPADAVTAAMKVVKPSAFAEKMAWFKAHPNATPEELQLAGITSTVATSIEEFEYYQSTGGEKDYFEFLGNSSGSQTITIGGEEKPYSPFWKKVDEDYAADYNEWISGVGADTNGNLVKIEEVLRALDSGEALTGPLIGSMPDFINKFFSPDVIQAREAVESVVQRNLKAILGAQFTEKEGERLISRAYNPSLSPELNAQRLRILVLQMKQGAEAKDAQAEWVRENGTLMGWKGQLSTWDDYWTAISQHLVGDRVCDNGSGDAKKCFTYQGGDSEIESNWELIK